LQLFALGGGEVELLTSYIREDAHLSLVFGYCRKNYLSSQNKQHRSKVAMAICSPYPAQLPLLKSKDMDAIKRIPVLTKSAGRILVELTALMQACLACGR
jgi:hypothetical protein